MDVAKHVRGLNSKQHPLPMFLTISDAVEWLEEHPIFLDIDGFSRFKGCFDWMCPNVDPTTETIEDDQSRNTASRFWFELGPWYHDEEHDIWSPSHDISLDTGGKTFEEAMWKLVKLVHQVYGGYDPVTVREHITKILRGK